MEGRYKGTEEKGKKSRPEEGRTERKERWKEISGWKWRKVVEWRSLQTIRQILYIAPEGSRSFFRCSVAYCFSPRSNNRHFDTLRYKIATRTIIVQLLSLSGEKKNDSFFLFVCFRAIIFDHIFRGP